MTTMRTMEMKGFTLFLAILVLVEVQANKKGIIPLKNCGASICMANPSLPFFETVNGSVSTHVVRCFFKPEKIRDKCVVNMTLILETLTTDQDVVLYVGAICYDPTTIAFVNSQNVTKKHAILYMQMRGHCSLSTEELSRWGDATDFRVFYMLENATLLEDNNSKPANKSLGGAENLGTLTFYKSKPQTFPSIFKNYVWPKMAEVQFYNLQLSSIPPELRITMPFLQSLELSHNNLTKPPVFPWCNSTLQLPRGLRRTQTGNHHYQYGTVVHPRIYRRFFDLAFNNIEDLSTHEFSGFLHRLSLEGNGLRVVGPSCFRSLRGIHVIDLSTNSLTRLPEQLFQGLDELLELRLDHNNISELPEELFKSQGQIKRMDLDHNRLGTIREELFHELNSLEVLHLEYNHITKVDDKAFPLASSSLREIYLQNNKITRLPKSLLLQRKASKIDLSSNLISFKDLDNVLQELDLDTFVFQHRKTASSPQLKLQESLKHISLANNNFTTININEFNETKRALFELLLKVYEIDMTGNPLHCDCKIFFLVRWIRKLVQEDERVKKEQFLSWKCSTPIELRDKPILLVEEDQFKSRKDFENCPEKCLCFVRSLDRKVIVDCKGRNLVTMPRKVPRGPIELQLQNNNIRRIPPYPYMENVTALYLTHNKIELLNASTLSRLRRIKVLFLDSNKLTALPSNIENLTFTTLALHHNFFKCDCTAKWMKKWLIRKKAHIQNIENVLCNSENAQGRAIYTLPDEAFVCKEEKQVSNNTHTTIKEKTFKIIAFTFGCFLVVCAVVFILAYKYRGEVKVFIYTHFNWHPFDRIDDSDPTKIYDAFVSYSGADWEWVVNTLQERLETHDPPYKLCIHDRDFLAGAPIQENIMNSVNQSKRMLMVLSQNFIRSEWCLLEFRAAHQKVLEERTNYLIIILFDDVIMDDLDDEMKLYMRTNTYLSISNKWFWNKLFYALPQRSHGEPSHKNLSSACRNKGLECSSERVFNNKAYQPSDMVEVVLDV